MKLKRCFSTALAALVLVGLLAACSGGAGSTAGGSSTPSAGGSSASAPSGSTQAGTDLQPANLRVWGHWGSEQRRPTIERIIEMFNAEYAEYGITAEYVYVPFGELETKLVAAITGGNPPDVAITAVESVNVKAMRNQATDITEYLEPDTQSKFYDRYWDNALYDGKVYALPFNTDTRFIYYNKTMFEEAGVNADDIQTWDDLLAAGDKLDAKYAGTGNYRAAFSPVVGNFGFDAVAIANGGQSWDDPMNPSTSTLDSKENIEALEYMREWGDRYGALAIQSMIDAGSGAEDPFISGQVAMVGQTCNYIATLEKYGMDEAGNWIIDYGAFALPTGPSYKEGGPRSFGGGFVVTVPKGVPQPREATKLAEFLACGEAANIWAVEQRSVMCSIEANEQPELAGATGWDLTLELLPFTQMTRRHIYCPDSATVTDTQIFRVTRDFEDVSPQEVLQTAQTEIENTIANEKAIFGAS